MPGIDEVTLNFNPQGLKVLGLVMAFIIFGVALEIETKDFVRILKKPKGPIIGLFSQFLLLPMITTLIVIAFKPSPSIALGIILVASCPGGNLSNFLTHISKGNTALSVTMSAISTIASIAMTPLNFSFWGSLYPPSANILKKIHIDPIQVSLTILLILIIPTLLGMFINQKKPILAAQIRKPMKLISMIFFLGFLIVALAINWEYFIDYIGLAFFIVLITNALALSIGFAMAKAFKLSESDAKACAFEIGIQNAGFALLLVYGFFEGLGGMALIAAWWGVWHIVSGFLLAAFWAKKVS